MKLKSSHLACLIPILMTLLSSLFVGLTACKPADGQASSGSNIKANSLQSGEWQDISDIGLPTHSLSGLDYDEALDIADVEYFSGFNSPQRSLRNYLRTKKHVQSASKMIDVAEDIESTTCNRRLHLQIDANMIERNDEQLMGDYCDYVIYLTEGQTLNVESDQSQVHAYLVSPLRHDFDNGPVQATADDRYVIRIKYVGVEYQTEPVTYDLIVVVD